ncbi:MAG: hypothetical protein QOH31_280 [Verrucomicrobiota bacterium]|jgi:hypothetical protein
MRPREGEQIKRRIEVQHNDLQTPSKGMLISLDFESKKPQNRECLQPNRFT